MAHAAAPLEHSPAAHEDTHAGHGGHGHAGHGEHDTQAATGHPCLYCPPHGSDGGACGDAGDCAYPHDPQVDARAATMLAAAMPAGFVVHVPRRADRPGLREPDTAEAVPRVSLSISYCRFIE
jgi:hypothetical protein